MQLRTTQNLGHIRMMAQNILHFKMWKMVIVSFSTASIILKFFAALSTVEAVTIRGIVGTEGNPISARLFSDFGVVNTITAEMGLMIAGLSGIIYLVAKAKEPASMKELANFYLVFCGSIVAFVLCYYDASTWM